MQGKIALEEHSPSSDARIRKFSAPMCGTDLGPRLLDIQDMRLKQMDGTASR